MSQKEKQSELQVMQLVSSLIAGVLLAFGVSVVVLFVTAHLAAGGKIGTGAVGNAEVIASGLGCFCGSCYLALSYRRVPAGRDAQPHRRRGRWGSGGVLVRWGAAETEVKIVCNRVRGVL